MCSGLLANTSLVHIDLGNNDIGPEGCIALFEALARCSTGGGGSLISLDVSNREARHRNRAGPRACPALNNLLLASPVLTILNIKDALIGNEGLEMIAEGLRNSASLSSLDLGANDLSGNVIEQLAPLLRSRELRHLSLSRNRLN